MKHTYLTEDIIKDALTHHSITKKEAKELSKVISRCAKMSMERHSLKK